jgi:hypothetical protein
MHLTLLLTTLGAILTALRKFKVSVTIKLSNK